MSAKVTALLGIVVDQFYKTYSMLQTPLWYWTYWGERAETLKSSLIEWSSHTFLSELITGTTKFPLAPPVPLIWQEEIHDKKYFQESLVYSTLEPTRSDGATKTKASGQTLFPVRNDPSRRHRIDVHSDILSMSLRFNYKIFEFESMSCRPIIADLVELGKTFDWAPHS